MHALEIRALIARKTLTLAKKLNTSSSISRNWRTKKFEYEKGLTLRFVSTIWHELFVS